MLPLDRKQPRSLVCCEAEQSVAEPARDCTDDFPFRIRDLINLEWGLPDHSELLRLRTDDHRLLEAVRHQSSI